MICVINLEEAAGRRNRMLQELRKVSCACTLFNAIDGRKFSQEQIFQIMDSERAVEKYRVLTGGELGCALSHIGVWNNFLASDDASVVILEDDVHLAKDFASILIELDRMHGGSVQPVVVLLGKADVCYRRAKLLGGAALHEVKYSRGAYGYWVNRSGASLLKDFLSPVWTEIDNWPLVMQGTKLKVYCLSHAVVGLSSENDNSMIGNERNRLEYCRIYRGNLLQRMFLRIYHSIRWRLVALIEFIDPRVMQNGNHAYMS